MLIVGRDLATRLYCSPRQVVYGCEVRIRETVQLTPFWSASCKTLARWSGGRGSKSRFTTKTMFRDTLLKLIQSDNLPYAELVAD